MRRPGLRVALAVAATATLVAGRAPAGADDTGISAGVDSVLELSFDHPAPGRLRATATATVGPTSLGVAQPGAPLRALRTFRGTVTRARALVPAARAGATEQTITYGVQAP